MATRRDKGVVCCLEMLSVIPVEGAGPRRQDKEGQPDDEGKRVAPQEPLARRVLELSIQL